MKKLYYLLFGIVLALGLASTFVAAAPDNVLEPILQAVESFHVADNYIKYHLAVDFIIYLIIFVGVGRTTLGKKLGNGPAVGIGLILAIGLTAFEAKLGYAVYDFGFIGAIIIAFLIGLFIYKMITDNGGNALTAFAIAYLLIYTLLQKSLLEIMDKYPLIYGIMSLVFIICLFKVIMSVFGLFKGGSFPGFSSGGNTSGWNTKTPEQRREDTKLSDDEKKVKNDAESAEKKELEISKLSNWLQDLTKELEKLEGVTAELQKTHLVENEKETILIKEITLAIQTAYEEQKILKKILNIIVSSNKINPETTAPVQEHFEVFNKIINQLKELLKKLLKRYSEKEKLYENEFSVNNRFREYSNKIDKFEKERENKIIILNTTLNKELNDINRNISNLEKKINTTTRKDSTTLLKNILDECKLAKNKLINEGKPLFEQIKKDSGLEMDKKKSLNQLDNRYRRNISGIITFSSSTDLKTLKDNLKKDIEIIEKALKVMNNFSSIIDWGRVFSSWKLGSESYQFKRRISEVVRNWFVDKDITYIYNLLNNSVINHLKIEQQFIQQNLQLLVQETEKVKFLEKAEENIKVLEDKLIVITDLSRKTINDVKSKLSGI